MKRATINPAEEFRIATNAPNPVREVVGKFNEAPTIIRSVNGYIRSWNRGAERFYGWLSEEAVGANSYDLLSTKLPIDINVINKRLVEDGFWQGELVHRNRSGKQIKVVSHWILQKGSECDVIEITDDINERRKSEMKLRYYEAIIADSNDAIIGKSLDGLIKSWNYGAACTFGWPEAEVLGRPISMIIPSERLAEEDAIIKQLKQGNRIQNFQTIRKHRDGRALMISLSISPIFNDRGDIVGASKIARDITKQHKIDKVLQRAQQMIAVGELSAGIAHDFKNILTVVANNTAFLRHALALTPEASNATDSIFSAVFSGSALAKRLLAFARQKPLSLDVIDFNTYLPPIMDLLRRSLGEGIDLRIEYGIDLFPVRADHSQLTNVVMNLVLNARDAMPNGGQICVKTDNCQRRVARKASEDMQFVTIEVTDNGLGMAPDVLQRAQEPFFTTKPGEKGNGLGLSMAQDTMSRHAGFLEISSTLNEGTRVSLFIPRARGDKASHLIADC